MKSILMNHSIGKLFRSYCFATSESLGVAGSAASVRQTFRHDRHGETMPKVAALSVGAALMLALAGCGNGLKPEASAPETPAGAAREAVTEPDSSPASTTAAPTSSPPLETLIDDLGFVSLEEIPAFYLAAVDSFPHPLPAGTDWPAGIPSGYNDPHGVYEADSLGETIASTYWHCAWEGEFLDAHESNDQSRQAAALAMLDIWVSDPYFTENFEDPEQGWKSHVLDPAKNGDLLPMKREHWNCPTPD